MNRLNSRAELDIGAHATPQPADAAAGRRRGRLVVRPGWWCGRLTVRPADGVGGR